MSTVTDAASGTQFAGSISELNEIRSRDPGRIKRLLEARRKRDVFGPDGRLMIVACDHPARGALSASGRATAMASRTDLLYRLVTALTRPGVDGVLVLDLPIEEAGGFRDAMAARDIDMIFLLSPTTTDVRLKEAARLGRGFLYGISRLGVTGARDTVADGAEALAGRMRAATSLPIALGFGISSPAHVRQIGTFADAAVVGSGLVGVIAEAGKSPDLVERVESYVRWLRGDADIHDNRRAQAADRSA